MDTLNPPDYRHDTVLPLPMEVTANAWAVDAACSGNPGPMEYQAIDLATGAQVFHFGPTTFSPACLTVVPAAAPTSSEISFLFLAQNILSSPTSVRQPGHCPIQ